MQPMETAIAVLLVSALTTTGLLALWAATSRRHWFLRTAAFLAALSPLLLVPAYEPFVALALQGGVVAGGVAVAGALSRKRRKELEGAEAFGAGPQWRFSMATLLLAMVLCGVAAAVASQAPRLNWLAWQSVALIGITSGMATLLGWWAATRQRWGVQLAASAIALTLAWLLGYGLHLGDWLAPSLTDFGFNWPPDNDPTLASVFSGGEFAPVWLIALPSIAALVLTVVVVVVAILGLRRSPPRVNANRYAAWAAKLCIFAGATLIAAPAIAVLCRLLTPEPAPIVRVPEPNAFNVFVEAGGSISNATINSANFDQSTATRGQLKKAVDEVVGALQQAKTGFSMESVSPVDYSFGAGTLPMEQIQNLRSLARAFSAESRLARLDGDYERSLSSGLEVIQLGYQSHNGGMLVEALVGAAITSIGTACVYEIHDNLSAESCLNAVRRIEAAESAREPIEAVLQRDYLWELYAGGWHGRLYAILSRLCDERITGEDAFTREEATTSLLKAHLQLRAYRLEHGSLPATWEKSGLPPLPTDPWDPEAKPLRYLRTDDGYVLYSVGPNGVDHGGAKPAADDLPGRPETGDFRLDVVYAPEIVQSGAEPEVLDEDEDVAVDDE
jgi:hypothetical protein